VTFSAWFSKAKIRNGHDYRYPLVVQAALQNRQKQFVLDGRPSSWASTRVRTSTRCARSFTLAVSIAVLEFPDNAEIQIGQRVRGERPINLIPHVVDESR
jgi:hypothetical protein